MSGAIDLSGRVAVVTGAGQGLGRAYAVALAAAGAAVVVNDVNGDAATETAGLIAGAGGSAATVVAPVGPTETAEQLVQTAVSEFGRLDAMVTNAGVLRDRVLWKMADDDFDLVVETHLRGTFTCARAAAIHMREAGEGGRLILVGSPAGQRGNFGQTNYSAAKAGIVCFARTWAMELARNEITVNAVIPTAWTAMTATIPAYGPLVERVEAGEGLPKAVRQAHAVGMPEDCAPLIVYLAAAESAGVTGQAIGLGGDKLAMWTHPTEVASAFMDGGWSAEEIAENWSTTVGPSSQSIGVILPELDLG